MKNCISRLALGSLCFSAIQAQYLNLEPTVRDNDLKNIAFVAHMGGASHYNWVLNIVNELGLRGHNTTYITNVMYARFFQCITHSPFIKIGCRCSIRSTLFTRQNCCFRFQNTYGSFSFNRIKEGKNKKFISVLC
jgi:hypothetical protein